MSRLERGDLYWGDLDPGKGSEQAGRRPVIILQDTHLIPSVRTVVVIPVTSRLHLVRLPTVVAIGRAGGCLAVESAALCHHIRALAIEGIGSRIGSLPVETLATIEEVVLVTLGLTTISRGA